MADLESTETKLNNGKKIIFRNATQSDAEILWDFRKAMSETSEFLLTSPSDIKDKNLSNTEKVLERYKNSNKDIWIIGFHENQLVASLNFKSGENFKNQHTGVLGMGVLSPYRNMGIGIQILNIFMKWFKNNNALLRVELEVMVGNNSAYNLYMKTGFKIEGIKKEAFRQLNGQLIDSTLMAFLKT